MIAFPRGLARSFRAVARKCVSGRPRGPAPPVVFESKAGTLSAWVGTGDAVLIHSAPAAGGGGDEVVVVPMAVLDAVGGAGDDPVELCVRSKLRGEARWADRGVPRAHAFDAPIPGNRHRPPDPPPEWLPVGREFLAALHACGGVTAREPGRYALTRVQVKGAAGQVAASDGRQALLWAGFAFPFADDVLVPAVPAFGAKELAAEPDVRVGRTAAHLAVGAGPWTVFLPVDARGAFPDVAALVPTGAPAVAGIDDRDAGELLAALPGLPGAADEGKPVTLDLGGGVVVRGRDDATGAVGEVRLPRSPAAGPAARVALDRRVLARALALGCLTVRHAPGRPVVFEGGGKTLLTVALDPSRVAEPATPDPAGDTPVPEPLPERRTAVRPHDTNGHAGNGRHDPPPPDAPDPLAAAEELRAALAEALTRAGRLVAALKGRKREQKALTQVWSSLKSLNLGP